MAQRHLEEGLRILAAVGRREVAEDRRTVEEEPEGTPGVLRWGVARLPGAVRGDEPALRLVRRPLQARQRARQAALDAQDAVAAGQTCELAAAAALDDQYVAVLEGLQRHRAQQSGRAAAGPADREEMRLGRARTGAPDDRWGVPPLLAEGERERARDPGRVGEAEDGLARSRDETLGGDIGGKRRQHRDRELVALLVPREAVLAPAARLGVQQLLDTGTRVRLPVGEVRGVVEREMRDTAGVVELVRGEGLVPLAAVGVERGRVLGDREVGDERFVERFEALGLRLVGSCRPGRGAVPAVPRRRPHQGDDGEQRPVRDEGHDQDDRSHQEQQWTAPVLWGVRPLAPSGGSQPAQSTGDRDQWVKDVGGAVGGRPGQVPTAGDLRAAGTQNAGKRAPGHCCLLEVRANGMGVRT